MVRAGLSLLVVIALAICCGCGSKPDLPELGSVTGTVTLDGTPVEGARVAFEPQGKGALASGTTDASGKYELMYGPNAKGAALGLHTVRIEMLEGDKPVTQPIPDAYNANSKLTADIKPGENKFDFELKSKP